MKPRIKYRSLIILCFGLLSARQILPQALTPTQSATTQPIQPTLTRDYRDGELVAYKMQGVNQGHTRTISYEARAEGHVKKDPSGAFIEEFAWSDVHVNGAAFPLSPASQQFRETLSLAPNHNLSIPDLSKIEPILIGPVTDLLAFYADVQLAMRQKDLTGAGSHVYVKHGIPNSWADGTYILLGQDAIDFDITLQSIDQINHVATLIVRHVPPAQQQIKLPATWMLNPIGGSPNNWIEVEKGSDGKYTAEVGQETFEAEIKVSLPTGRIISATMDNPVDVLERDCDDQALTACGSPLRYRIKRHITVDAEQPPPPVSSR